MIVNLTQHPATAEQTAVGVVDLGGDALMRLRNLLTFSSVPDRAEIAVRAVRIAAIAHECGEDVEAAMIGGAGYLIPALERELWSHAIEPLHAFTVREVVEVIMDDGSVQKTATFRHGGFVPGC